MGVLAERQEKQDRWVKKVVTISSLLPTAWQLQSHRIDRRWVGLLHGRSLIPCRFALGIALQLQYKAIPFPGMHMCIQPDTSKQPVQIVERYDREAESMRCSHGREAGSMTRSLAASWSWSDLALS